MIRILLGFIVALIVAVGLQTWQLSAEKEHVSTLTEENQELSESLIKSVASYKQLEQAKDQSINLLITRGQEREHRIAELAEQNRRLSAIPDDNCLDRPMPGDVVRLLRGQTDTGTGASQDVSTKIIVDDLPKTGDAGNDISRPD